MADILGDENDKTTTRDDPVDTTVTAGHDVIKNCYIIRDGDGSETIKGFDLRTPDTLVYDLAEITTFQDLASRLAQDGPDTIIIYDNGETTRLIDVDATDLGPHHFATSVEQTLFHEGAQIETPKGWSLIEDLAPGDHIRTFDGRHVEVTGMRRQRLHFSARNDPAKPILIRQDSIAAGQPYADCIVSPAHRIALPGPEGALSLVAAVELCDRPGIRRMLGRKRATYHTLLTEEHVLVSANGMPVESALSVRIPAEGARQNAAPIPAMQPSEPETHLGLP